EAGVGKSRLHWEFTRSHHADGWLVLRSRSSAYARGTPYLHVIELLKPYLGMQERDDSRQVRERVADKLRTLDRTLGPVLTPLLALFDVPVQDAAWAALAPPQRRQRILEAVKRLLLRQSQVQPLLLVVAAVRCSCASPLTLRSGIEVHPPPACWARYWGKSRTNSAKRTL